MKNQENMILTKELLEDCGTAGHGFSYKQLEILGVTIPPIKRWKKNIIGTYIKKTDYKELKELKGITKKKGRLNNSNQITLDLW